MHWYVQAMLHTHTYMREKNKYPHQQYFALLCITLTHTPFLPASVLTYYRERDGWYLCTSCKVSKWLQTTRSVIYWTDPLSWNIIASVLPGARAPSDTSWLERHWDEALEDVNNITSRHGKSFSKRSTVQQRWTASTNPLRSCIRNGERRGRSNLYGQ